METRANAPVERLICEARDNGIADPVVLYIEATLANANAIHRHLHGSDMVPEDIGCNTVGTIEVVSRDVAGLLLRQYVDKGGRLLAGMLHRCRSARHSHIRLFKVNAIMVAATGEREYEYHIVGYDNVELRLHQSSTLGKVGGNLVWLLEMEDGELVPLCCDVRTVFRVGYLTVLAATRKHWVTKNRKQVEIEAFDSDLADKLLEYKDQPGVIAETIRALRKIGPEKDRWINSVLWGRKPLRNLARKVEQELTGVSPA